MTYKESDNQIHQNHNINSVILAQITSIFNIMKLILNFKSTFFHIKNDFQFSGLDIRDSTCEDM